MFCVPLSSYPKQALERLSQLSDIHERYIHHKSISYHSSILSRPVQSKDGDHQPSSQSSPSSITLAISVNAESPKHHWLQGSSHCQDVEGLTEEERQQLLTKTWSRRSRCTVSHCTLVPVICVKQNGFLKTWQLICRAFCIGQVELSHKLHRTPILSELVQTTHKTWHRNDCAIVRVLFSCLLFAPIAF